MLNRIYIVVGLLAILVLAGAFVLPRFIQWSDYRDRMEVLASGVLGAEVTILGDIEFSLLPQPRLRFSEVVVGDLEAPLATVAEVEAEFALMEFLRDRYDLTRLVLARPMIDLVIDENGLFETGFSVGAEGAGVAVSLQQARLVDGRVRLLDLRAGETVTLEDIDGDLRLSAFTGPFQFQGTAANAEGRVQLRFSTSALDAQGNSRLSLYYQQTGAYAVSAEGLFTPGPAPRYEGNLTYRQFPPQALAAGDIRGDLVLESRVQANTDRIVLSSYTLTPDANRPGTRLTGAASIQLGAMRSFDAVISGGVFALAPRDATEDQSGQPYELVRLLRELPAPPRAPLPGKVGIDLAEMNLRAFSLRDVRVDAETDGDGWTIRQFVARMPGDTELRASGVLTAENGRPGFSGDFSASVSRLDALAQLWRRPAEDNPLFNVPASYRGRVILGADALGFVEGAFTLNGTAHRAGLRIGFGEEARIDVTARFGALTAADSAALAALPPDALAGPAFGNSFPQGSFSLLAAEARIFGLFGHDLIAQGDWSADGLSIERLAAADLGGAGFDLEVDLGGSLSQPRVAAEGMMHLAAADAPALGAVYDQLGVPPAWRDWLAPSLPARLAVALDAPDAAGAQDLRVEGVAGVADLDLALRLNGGITGAFEAPLVLRLFLEAADAEALTAQLGLREGPVFSGVAPGFVSVSLAGASASGFDARINVSAGEEVVSFAGDLAFAEGEARGAGRLEVELEDIGGLVAAAGGRLPSLPPVSAEAALRFEGARVLTLSGIGGRAGGEGFRGDLSVTRVGGGAEVSGALLLDTVSLEGVTAALLGRAAPVALGEGPWPDGPLEVAPAAGQTRGAVAVSAPVMTLGGVARLADPRFDIVWDAARVRLGNGSARLGAGAITADLTFCCSGAMEERTLAGRATLEGVALADIVPESIGAQLSARVSAGVLFEGAGADIAAMLDGLAGEGNVTLADIIVQNLDPTVYGTVAGLEDILDMEPETLESIIGMALWLGPFRAEAASAPFTIAGGALRLSNLSITGNGAHIGGGLTLALDTLGLEAVFTMTPRDFEDARALILEDTARIVSRVSGPLWALERVLDLDVMVAAITVRANELEVERLEALRLENEARQRAAAEERNRLVEEQLRQRALEEAARLAAEPPPQTVPELLITPLN